VSQIQALDRTQPGLPMKKGRAGTMTHDYKRHGVTTLFAALNVLEGKVFGQCRRRHRHEEFIRFLNVIDARMPKKKAVQSSTTMPLTSTPTSWNGWPNIHASSSTSPRHPPHGSMPSGVSSPTSQRNGSSEVCSDPYRNLKVPSIASSTSPTASPKPFTWTKDPNKSVAAVKRGHQALDSLH
jgi:hypothetical protein